MLRFLFIFPLVAASLSLKAQHEEIIFADTLQGDKVKNTRILIAPAYNFIQFAGTFASFATLSAAASFNNHLEAGISASFNLNDFEKQIIFPQYYQYNQFNLGVYGQYSFFKKKVRPLAGMALIFTFAEWQSGEQAQDKFTDDIVILKLYVGAGWQFTGIFSIQVNAGYNIPGDVELISFVPDDYRGFSGDIILKINILQL